MKAQIEIRAPNAAPVRREVGSETVIVGKNPRPGMNGVAVATATDMSDEHLIVSFVRDRFHVALATGARIEPALNGKSFRQAEIAFGDEVIIGRTSIRFLGKAKSNAPNPIITLAAVVVLSLSVWSLFNDATPAGLNTTLPPPPALFPPDAPCPYTGPQALGRAAEAEQAGMAHSERYSFEPYDGVQAALAYRLAATCFTAGSDPTSAARAAASAQRWKVKLEGRYQGHQLRLRVALDRGRNDHALSEVRSLKRLLRGQNGPYMNWLIMAERQLTGPM